MRRVSLVALLVVLATGCPWNRPVRSPKPAPENTADVQAIADACRASIDADEDHGPFTGWPDAYAGPRIPADDVTLQFSLVSQNGESFDVSCTLWLDEPEGPAVNTYSLDPA